MEVKVFLAIADNLRILKVFIYEPLCLAFVHEWNEENPDDPCHQETHKITQQLNYCKECGYRIRYYSLGEPKRLCWNCRNVRGVNR